MSGKYIIGIDSGTSGIKAVLFDLYGNEVMKRGEALTPICPEESWFEEDAREIWAKAKSCLRAITIEFPPEEILGVGITAQGDGLWLFDALGEPTRNGCCFCDGRASEQFMRWTEDGTARKVFKISGTRLFTGNQPCVLKWMDEHERGTLDRTAHFMHLKDYLFYKLTGRATTDTTDQSLVFLDPLTGRFSDELFSLYGLERYRPRFPELKTPLENRARLLPETARELGLSPDTLITSGPMDVAACALGAGVVEAGDCCSIIGTAALHEKVIDAPLADEVFAGMTVCHAVEKRWLRLMASLAGTPNLEWVLGLLGDNVAGPAREAGVDLYTWAERMIAQSPIGAGGVLYHPYLLAGGERAPFTDPSARASFTGISVRHTPADLLRACYEDVAFAMLDCYQHMPGEIRSVTVCGGGASSAVWCQMFADMLGKPVHVVAGSELGAKGAVLTNAVAQGLFPDFARAVRKTVQVEKIYHPDLAAHREYARFFPLYRQTYQNLAGSWKLRGEILFSR